MLLPGEPLGSNSSWALVFVPCWWLVGFSAVYGFSQLSPWLEGEAFETASMVGMGVAVLGWIPGWYLFDAIRTSRMHRVLEVDAAGLTFDGKSWSTGEIRQVAMVGRHLTIAAADGITLVRHRCGAADESVLREHMAEFQRRLDARAGEAPEALGKLTESARL